MGTKNNSEDFVSSLTTSKVFSPSRNHYVNAHTNHQSHSVTNVGGAGRTSDAGAHFSPYSGKHNKYPMQQVSRLSAPGSFGLPTTTAAPPARPNQKEHILKQQHLGGPPPHPKKSSGRSGGDGLNRNNSHSRKAVVSTSAVNHSYAHSSKNMSTALPTSMFPSNTQHLPKYTSSNRFLSHPERDLYFSDDGMLDDFVDKRALYSHLLPPDYQHVLQDHSYSQLPESPPPPPIPTSPIHQRTTINGLGRVSSSSGMNKALNNNRVVNSGFSSHPNNMSGGSGRLNNEKLHSYSNTINNYSPMTNNVHPTSSTPHNITNATWPTPKKNFHHEEFSHTPRSLLKRSLIPDKPEESDLSEDDRLPDPHGEETETAPEAEGEEESVTRCICDFQHDDGYMISCDKCLAWQHVACMGIDWENIPDEYQCEKCQPRYIDKRRAIEIQKKKIENRLCVGLNDDSDSSDGVPTSSSRNKNQTKKKVKGKRTVNTKRKSIREAKETKQKKTLNSVKKRNVNDSTVSSGSPQSPSISSSGLSAEKKKQLLMERKQMLLEKKQINKKRTMRKQALNTKRNVDKMKLEDDYDVRNSSGGMDREDNHQNIQQVREWVDRYEEAVTNHYSQELRARLNAAQVSSADSDIKFATNLRAIEKCRTSLLSTGGKIVLATCGLSSNQPIIELRGKYMYTGAESFRQSKITQSTPYVFYYKLHLPKQDIEICVDCRSYGNFARFIRRSCKPNAELRHCIRKTTLHLYIIATQPLKKNSEILIGHYSPETARTCVCGSPENCTAALTPYTVVSSGKLNDRSRESHQRPRSVSPASRESIPKNRKNASTAERKKRIVKEGKKKLTKENRRGRRRSPSSATNSDQEESSDREDSPLPPAKLTVSLWGKPGSVSVPGDAGTKNVPDNENLPTKERAPSTKVVPSSDEDDESKSTCVESTDNEISSAPTASANPVTANTDVSPDSSPVRNDDNDASTVSVGNSADDTASLDNSTSKQTTRSTRQSEYARKEKQQLDMPLFFETPNNHKMTREEKKMQAIMKMFEAMEKSQARKQENQKHRRESSSESEAKKNVISRRNMKGRKSGDESKNHEEKTNGRIRKDSMNGRDDDEDCEDSKENSMKPVTKSESRDEDGAPVKKSGIIENGGRIKVENRDDEDDDADSDLADKESVLQSKNVPRRRQPPSRANNKLANNVKDESDDDSGNEGDTCKRVEKSKVSRTPVSVRSSRVPRPTPKARAIAKPKVTRGKKKRSESEAEVSPDTDVGDISLRTRSSIQRQKKTPVKEEKCSTDSKATTGYSPSKFRRLDDMLTSPCGTPPKVRERLDSSSSSGGTPPTPVSDTCLLVASAIGHLTDFKFPNTKKELMNAWFKEERKPSPDEENAGKLPNQEGNNEYAKKRWLRQAISEEGDGSIPRPEEAVSPNGEYGGPLKKRRFARESMSDQACGSLPPGSFGTDSQMSFDDEADLSSPDASPFRASEGDNVPACHPVSLQNNNKTDDTSLRPMKLNETDTMRDTMSDVQVDEEIAKVASESVADTIASILAPVNAQMISPPRPPSVSPPRTPSPPPEETDKLAPPPVRSVPVSKKKLSLTEYQRRKGSVVPPIAHVPAPVVEPVDVVLPEASAVAGVPPRIVNAAAAVVGKSSSRSSDTSSSASEDEDDKPSQSHVASAEEVIARSLMIESRHLSYGPQASALFNSIRSGASAPLFNAKPATTPTGPPLTRENLADRLKHEFGVHVQEDENEKNKNALTSSPIKIPVQITTGPIAEKDFRMKKTQPPPPPPGPPPLPIIPPPLLPPLPDPPRLFQPTFYPYPVPRVPPALSGTAPLYKEQLRSAFFVAPPPPPPSGAPPSGPLVASNVPPPPASK